MNTAQVCHFFRPIMEHQDEEKGGGIKRKFEENKFLVNRERIILKTFFDLQEDVINIIFSELDKKVLGVFETVSKAASSYTENVWKFWRQNDYLNFSWASIPTDEPGHHKWSFLLNYAIVDCVDKVELFDTMIDEYVDWDTDLKKLRCNVYDREIMTGRLEDSTYVAQKYSYLYRRFLVFRCFADTILQIPSKKEAVKKLIYRVANENKCGGELALKAILHALSLGTFESMFDSYMEAVDKNATFLLRRWDYYALYHKQRNQLPEEAREKAVSAKIRLAIKAVERGDHTQVVKMLYRELVANNTRGERGVIVGRFKTEQVIALIVSGLKLPYIEWLKVARKRSKYGKIPQTPQTPHLTLLFYAKAIESYRSEGVQDLAKEDLIYEEAGRIISRIKISEDVESDYDYDSDTYPKEKLQMIELFWKEKAEESLRKIKETLEAKIAIKIDLQLYEKHSTNPGSQQL